MTQLDNKRNAVEFTSKNIQEYFNSGRCPSCWHTNNFSNGPMYINPYGELYEIDDTHIHTMIDLFYDGFGLDVEFPNITLDQNDEDFDDYEIADAFLYVLEEEFGWIRINSGKTASENRTYVAISQDARIKPSQYDTLLEWFYFLRDNLKVKSVSVLTQKNSMLTRSDYANYDLQKVQPEDIIEKIKDYYRSGVLEENMIVEDKKRKKNKRKGSRKDKKGRPWLGWWQSSCMTATTNDNVGDNEYNNAMFNTMAGNQVDGLVPGVGMSNGGGEAGDIGGGAVGGGV